MIFLCVGAALLFFRSSPESHLENSKLRIANGEAKRAQQYFPEGEFLTLMLYGSSWINVGLSSLDENFKQQAATEAFAALTELEKTEVAQQFSQATQLEHGIFYSGWLNRLRGGILLVQGKEPDPKTVDDFHAESEHIAQAFLSSDVPFLASYPDQTWPVDSIPALSSLRIHDKLYGTEYESQVISRWRMQVSQQYAAEKLFPHQVERETGLGQKPARGASTSLLLSLLPEVDPELSAKQFELYKQTFVSDFGLVTLAREYPKQEISKQNTNSGPIFLGFGASASVVNIAAAHANADIAGATRSSQFFDTIGIPFGTQGNSRYFLGKFLLYDVLLTWSRTHRPWI